jgi:hypothetical protein
VGIDYYYYYYYYLFQPPRRECNALAFNWWWRWWCMRWIRWLWGRYCYYYGEMWKKKG